MTLCHLAATMFSLSGTRALVCGGTGLIGSRVCGLLQQAGAKVTAAGSTDADITDPAATMRLFERVRPQLVVHLAGEGGGITAHRENPGRHLYANAMMALNIVETCRRCGVERLVMVASADAYPPDAAVPLREQDLLTGTPGDDVDGYAAASRLLVSLLRGYNRQYGLNVALLVLTNVYGPGMSDDFEHSFVVPAMIRRFRDAVAAGDQRVVCWGSGRATRDFLYVEDAARAIVEAARRLDTPEPVNIGSGCETTITDLAHTVAGLLGYKGTIDWDTGRPEGIPRRVLDTTRARELLDFGTTVDLEEGLRLTLADG